jgi:hypothetical protein
MRLQADRRPPGIDADRQIVQGDLQHIPAHSARVMGIVGQRLTVGKPKDLVVI